MKLKTALITLLVLFLAACGAQKASISRQAVGAAGTDPTFRGPLSKHGGSVQQHPRLVLVYWGSVWKSGSFQASVRTAEKAMIGKLAGSDWGQILKQYGVANDIRLNREWVDTQNPPKRALGYKAVLAEVKRASSKTGIATGPNVQWLVFPPSTADLKNFTNECGEHDANTSADGTFVYGLIMPFNTKRFGSGGDSCGQYDGYGKSKVDATTSLTSHEIFEAATDPLSDKEGNGTGWWSDPAAKRFSMGAAEGGDFCYAQAVQPWGTNAPVVQALWSNKNAGSGEKLGCVASLSGGKPHLVGQFARASLHAHPQVLPAGNPKAEKRLAGS